MMKRLLLFISILLVTEAALSQQLPHYSLYMFNDAIINPAVVGTKSHDYVTLMLRDQWTGFEGAPKTQLISLEKKYNEIYGIGGGIVNDKTGPISRLSGILSGSYRIPFNNNVISFGASGRISQYKFDNSQITLENDGIVDPAMQGGLEKTLEHSITIGTQYIHDDYYIAASIPNIISSKLNVNKNGGKNRIINHYYINAGYHYDFSQAIDLEPSIMFKKTGPTPLQMDLNIRAVYDDFLWGGISYRTKDAVVIMLGIDYLDYRFAYSYDITTNALSMPSSGSHGLMLSYRIKQIEKDYDKDGVLDKDDDCPKIPGLIILNGCPDRDRDGIIDSEDECPDFPGLEKNNGCPDRDSDGVIDKFDRCPDIPGKKELNGCPDSDGDGLQDALDKCPEEFGPIENFGCPEDLNKELVKHSILVFAFENLEFEFNKAIITFKSQSFLNKAGQYLIENQDVVLKVIGHTDNVGTDRYNLILSKNRALAVKRYLIDRGIAYERIKVGYFGKSQPIDTSGTEDGMAKNRRVEFEVIEE